MDSYCAAAVQGRSVIQGRSLVGHVAVDQRGGFVRVSRFPTRAGSDNVTQHGLQTVKDPGSLCLATEMIPLANSS